LPQAAALFWLLASNYLQHAHARGDSEFAHSRNFLGGVNQLGFNVGYHSAHHHDPDRHWSELPELHARIAHRIPSRLLEPGLLPYMTRVFVLALFLPRLRSTPLAVPPMEPLDGN
jgi:fatty acid desaturase